MAIANGITLTPQAESYLEALAADIAISETRYEQAERSYKALGDWLHRSVSTVRTYGPQVYVQGSFGLGTVIKPLSDEEDYDVDSICELERLNTRSCSQDTLKKMLGAEIYAYHDANSMKRPVREGRRCWVLDYVDGAQFHMDIVPAVPDSQRQRLLLEKARLPTLWAQTAIAITDNERWNYSVVDVDWCRSNPKGYIRWFRQRMAAEFEARRKILAESVKARVEEIPEYRVRTPLQSAIMILKRHRDWRFSRDLVNRPISIILTTLAAHSYESERMIGQALISILRRMDSFIAVKDGRYVIFNPTDPLENFADKWDEFPERRKAFFSWLEQARSDFAQIATLTDSHRIAESITPAIGRGLAERAHERIPGPKQSLLRPGSVASTTAPQFPNHPRVPTAPKGFA